MTKDEIKQKLEHTKTMDIWDNEVYPKELVDELLDQLDLKTEKDKLNDLYAELGKVTVAMENSDYSSEIALEYKQVTPEEYSENERLGRIFVELEKRYDELLKQIGEME